MQNRLKQLVIETSCLSCDIVNQTLGFPLERNGLGEFTRQVGRREALSLGPNVVPDAPLTAFPHKAPTWNLAICLMVTGSPVLADRAATIWPMVVVGSFVNGCSESTVSM